MNYCGCCGRPVADLDADWCAECDFHVLPELTYDVAGSHRRLPYQRTYFAQHKKRCPFGRYSR